MYVDIVPNRSSPPAILIRESFREDGKVRKRTRANLSGVITVEEAKQLKRILAGETLVPASEAFEISSSKAHGHVLAVALAMSKLRMAELLHSRSSRERDLVLALVAARIIRADTKLATSRSWDDSTLASEFGVSGAGADELYTAMD